MGAARPPVLDDCCLVVPTFQRPDDVVALLEVLETLPDAPGEVVFVDGSRDDGTAAALDQWRRGRSLVFDLAFVRSLPGLTRQRNVGIDASSRDFVFYLDDDCRPEPGYFAAIRDVFRQDREGVIGAVCGSIVNEMDRPVSLRWRLRRWLGLIPADAQSGRYYPTATSVPRSQVKPFTGLRDVELVPGGAVAYRRAVLDANRFSLFFDGYAQGEDVEMSLRIGRQWKLAWCGEAHVGHFHSAAGRPDAFRKGRMEVRNRFFIWKRYSADASLGNRVRFWLDIVFVFACDLGYMVARRPRADHFWHAIGVARGAIECVASPPRYEEPLPRREYEIAWQQ